MNEPTLREEGGVSVVTLYETRREHERVATFEDAIELVEACHPDAVCEKIVTRDDEVVYDSTENGDVEDWATEWRVQLRRLSRTEDSYACPHENTTCTEDDQCPDCRLDEQIEAFSVSGFES